MGNALGHSLEIRELSQRLKEGFGGQGFSEMGSTHSPPPLSTTPLLFVLYVGFCPRCHLNQDFEGSKREREFEKH